MEKHEENMTMLCHMMCVLRERQDAWELTEMERVKCKKGIQAFEAALHALSVQVYA